MSASRYLPDGARVDFPSEEAAAAAAAQCPDLATLENWRSRLGSRHPDLFPGGTIKTGAGVFPSPS